MSDEVPESSLLGSKNNPCLFFGTEEAIDPVPIHCLYPSGYTGWCIGLGYVIERAIKWLDRPNTGSHDFFPEWIFEARKLIFQMEAFKGLHRYFEFPDLPPKNICGRFFPSAHLGIEQYTQSLIDRIAIAEHFWQRQEEYDSRKRGAATPYQPIVWLKVSEQIRKETPDFEERFYRELEEENAIVKKQHPYLWPEHLRDDPAIPESPAKPTNDLSSMTPRDRALAIIASLHRSGGTITIAELARQAGVSRKTVYEWDDVKRAHQLLNGDAPPQGFLDEDTGNYEASD